MAAKTWLGASVHKWLTSIWVTFTILIAAIILAFSMFSTHIGDSDALWRWFVPRVAPFLAVVLSVWQLRIRGLCHKQHRIERTRAIVACASSVAYLLLLLAILLLHPFTPFTLAALLERFSLPMDFFQTAVSAVLTIFFLRSEAD